MNPVAQSLALAMGVSALVTVACARVRLPAMLPLLLVGLALGGSGLGVVDGSSLGPALRGFITVAIGLLIFEGTLHLNKEELGRAPRAVRGLLTVGALVTWCGTCLAAWWLLGMALPVAVLLGAILMVTGPTVVQPILRLVRVAPRLHATLAAEAVLIDPLGVIATVTTAEVLRLSLLSESRVDLAREGAWLFAKPLVGGAGVGIVCGIAGYLLLRAQTRRGTPDTRSLNLLAIGVCMTCVGVAEAVAPEAGLAAVTLCGVIMARARVLGATELRAFKELLAIILVGTLFVLLASRFDLRRLGTLTWRDGAFVGALLLVVRPAGALLSTLRSTLDPRQRLFVAGFAPRGIVALSVAAVAAADLEQLPLPDGATLAGADRLELVAFVVIAASVLVATLASPALAWALGVRATTGSSVLVVGAHPLGVAFARWLHGRGVHVRLVDSNTERAAAAAAAGLDAVSGDATDTRWMDDLGSPPDTGWVLSWTGNDVVDQCVTRWAAERIGPEHAAVWSGRPMPDALTTADLGTGEPIMRVLDRFGDGEVCLVEAGNPSALTKVLGWVRDGKFALHTPNAAAPAGAVLVGIGPCPPGGG